MTLKALMTPLRRLRRSDDGSVAVETVMMVPLLAWAMLATLTYFDAYRAEAISNKASLTIADMFSRETDYITPDYMDGALGLLKFLTLADDTPQLRVTVVRWIAPDPVNAPLVGDYHVVWSQRRGTNGAILPLDTLELRKNFLGQIPIMSHNERGIIVETWTDHTPPYSVGLNDMTMNTFTVIRPRFASQLCWNPTPILGSVTAIC